MELLSFEEFLAELQYKKRVHFSGDVERRGICPKGKVLDGGKCVSSSTTPQNPADRRRSAIKAAKTRKRLGVSYLKKTIKKRKKALMKRARLGLK